VASGYTIAHPGSGDRSEDYAPSANRCRAPVATARRASTA
jgi:hypothetical protein